MTKRYCDRCGQEIFNLSSMIQASTALVSSLKIIENDPYCGESEREIDLCPRCAKKFYGWLNSESTQEE